jgi:Mrp family chromosome partitioning ATPase
VLDQPDVPYREDFVRLGLGLATAPLGLFLGAVFVLVRSAASGRLQHVRDAARCVGDSPILASIPRRAYKGGRLSTEYVEAFRTLRARVLEECSREKGNDLRWRASSVLLVTSPSNGDGKTTCAYFLASILARGGRSVLHVDTGLPRPSRESQAIERVAEEPGLGSILTGQLPRGRGVVTTVAVPDGDAFYSIPSGSVGSTDLLSSQAMSSFIEEARGAYDFVVMEAPSYPALSDTLVLSTMADCVVAVVRLEHTSRALAVDMLRQLSSSCSKLGVVLNDVRP